ncbi:MAG TPA: hypothetical protein VGR11_02670 [Solirubrobacteraceae bacterium]|nr:hypothetical protein [Solirubrobacteraceae bacterium]
MAIGAASAAAQQSVAAGAGSTGPLAAPSVRKGTTRQPDAIPPDRTAAPCAAASWGILACFAVSVVALGLAPAAVGDGYSVLEHTTLTSTGRCNARCS